MSALTLVAVLVGIVVLHAFLGVVSVLVVIRYERRGYEAQDRRREAFVARVKAET